MKKSPVSVLRITQAAMIAAIYVVLTVVISAFNLASGVIQVRISEALTILPVFTNAAVPGLFVGCLISNLITGCAPFDVIFGSIATLIGAVGTYLLRKKSRFLAPLPPIIANTLIVPFVLRYVYNIPDSIPFFMLTVGIGEIISCGFIGMILYHALFPVRDTLFPQPDPADPSSDDI
ncbi:MAG: QueT transporter family protein [Lachnospiraceae bacterium]|nr:QueT transporter family protein [Lachnospiraceae bacterium]